MENGDPETMMSPPVAMAKSSNSFYSKKLPCRTVNVNRRIDTKSSMNIIRPGMSQTAKKMTQEEEDRIVAAKLKTVDSMRVTEGVLKMNGITRDRVHYNRQFLSSKSGIGGGDFTFYRDKVRPPTCFVTVEPTKAHNLPKKSVTNSRRDARRTTSDFKKLFGNPSSVSSMINFNPPTLPTDAC